LIIKTKRKFDEMLKNIREEYEEKTRQTVKKAVADAEQDFHYIIEDLKGQLESINPNALSSQDDLFYKSLYSSYWGKDVKKTDEESNLTEAIRYGRSRGYFTHYNTPLERKQSDEFRRYAQTIAYVRAHEDPIVGQYRMLTRDL